MQEKQSGKEMPWWRGHSYEKASQQVRCDGHRFVCSAYVMLLSALLMDLLVIRCILGSAVGAAISVSDS